MNWKKVKMTTKKETKVTYNFTPTKSNYVELLNTMITRHTSLKVKSKLGASDK
jgi:hypothetical protein